MMCRKLSLPEFISVSTYGALTSVCFATGEMSTYVHVLPVGQNSERSERTISFSK